MSLSACSHPNEQAAAITGRDHLSWSQVETYRRCPLLYRFRYVDGLPEDVVPSCLAFGGSLHAAAEHHFNELMAGAPPPALERLLEVFWDAWRGYGEEAAVRFSKGEDVTTVARLAEGMLAAFRESDAAVPEGRILGVEEELRGEVVPGCPDLLARIDLLVETRSELVVTDLKTSGRRWSYSRAEDAGEQLLLYGELARRLVPGKVVRLDFAVLTKAKVPVVDRFSVESDPWRLGRTLRIVERVWRAIDGGHFYPTPSPVNCPSCPFRRACRDWHR